MIDKAGLTRDEVNVTFSSSNESIAMVNNFGIVNTNQPGQVNITAKAEEIDNTISINVVKNPIVKIELTADGDNARTGDVFHFEAKALDAQGQEVADAPITYSFTGTSNNVSQSASGLIKQDGRFVADEAGMYTITASAGVASA